MQTQMRSSAHSLTFQAFRKLLDSLWFPIGGITSSLHGQSISSPLLTAALAASHLGGLLCWLGWLGVFLSALGVSRLWQPGPAPGCSVLAGPTCTARAGAGLRSSRFVVETLPAELPLLLSNTVELPCPVVYGLYEIIGDF